MYQQTDERLHVVGLHIGGSDVGQYYQTWFQLFVLCFRRICAEATSCKQNKQCSE